MKNLLNNELFIIAIILLYFGIALALSCIFNNIAFIGCSLVIALLTAGIMDAISKDSEKY